MHVILDLDGVCADFVSSAFNLFRREYRPGDYPANVWDIANVLRVPESDFWGTIDREPNFWVNIRPYPWLPQLIEVIGDNPVTVATTPRGIDCMRQKLAWMAEHLPPRYCGSVYFGSEKWLLASEGTLLIDDNRENIKAFREHGGEAVLFLQPWNIGESEWWDGWPLETINTYIQTFL